MLFNSFEFLLFFPIVLVVYFLIPRKSRYIWLLAASYYFYMCWNVKYVALLLGTTLLTYLAALLIDRYRESRRRQKIVLAGGIVITLGLLGFFKYANFAIETFNKLAERLHGNPTVSAMDILLPMGISFYVFQAIGYMIDVYRGSISAEKNPLRYALFISFFPQLVAGPIERAATLMPRLRDVDNLKLWDTKRIQGGALLMLYGYFMKMVIADRASVFVDTVFDPGSYLSNRGLVYWVAAILFSIQIYCDFAGYTYIAIGAARIMGIDLMDNFHTPYLARSIRDFWDRWHISLSGWFRDYLYFPLGGSKKGKIRKYVNIFIVFLLSGLWHGASWHFVLWGALHGAMRIAGEMTGRFRETVYDKLKFRRDTFATKLWQTGCTFVLVTIAWVTFRAASIRQALDILKGMFTRYDPWVLFDGSLYQLGVDEKEFHVLVLAVLFLILVDVLSFRKRKLVEGFTEQNLWFRWLIFYIGIAVVVVFGVYGAEYHAAQFIYFQF